jgi:UDP-glucose 4-epimerase
MRDGRPVVLITGASGFVGRNLAPAMTRAGWLVRRAVRQRSGMSDEVVVESLGPATDWREALADVDAVVHLAARVHHKHEEHAVELYRSINIEGTLRLARDAGAAGVGQFVFISTVLVHGRNNDGRAPFRESDVPTPRGLYGMSKAAAEAGLKDLAQSSAMSVTVIRPPLVYGAGARGNFSLLQKAVTRGIPLPFAAIQNRRAFLSVGNLISFIQHRLSHPSGKFDIFLLADEEQVSTPEFIARLAKAGNTAPRLFRLPVPLLGALLKLSGRGEANDGLLGSLELDVSKARSIGWRPQIPLDEGLRQAFIPPGS